MRLIFTHASVHSFQTGVLAGRARSTWTRRFPGLPRRELKGVRELMGVCSVLPAFAPRCLNLRSTNPDILGAKYGEAGISLRGF